MKKILLLSVPHTGTVFISDYLEEIIGLNRIADNDRFIQTNDNKTFIRIHTTSPQRLENKKKTSVAEYAKNNCNVIIPLRHPIDNAKSCIARNHANLVYCSDCWNVMFEMYSAYNVFWVDIDILPEHRNNMMQQLSNFISCEPINQSTYDSFIDRWQKKNYTEYDKNILPPHHRYDYLNSAIEWYEKKKIELNKQYSMPLPMD